MDNYSRAAQIMGELKTATQLLRDGAADIYTIIYLHGELVQVHWSISEEMSEQFSVKEHAELTRKSTFEREFSSCGKKTVKEAEVYANAMSEDARMNEIDMKSVYHRQSRFLSSIENAIQFCTMIESKISKAESQHK